MFYFCHIKLIYYFKVLHPICSTLRVFDIADTSVTNYGLLTILRKMQQLHSLGEFSISDNFLRSLCVVTSLKVRRKELCNIVKMRHNIEIYKRINNIIIHIYYIILKRWTNSGCIHFTLEKFQTLGFTTWFMYFHIFAPLHAGSHSLI